MHTPGPWQVVYSVYAGDRITVYQMPTSADVKRGLRIICSGFSTSDEDEANAKLIAAAPELAAVMRELFVEGPIELHLGGNPHAIDALVKRAHAAIAKAGLF